MSSSTRTRSLFTGAQYSGIGRDYLDVPVHPEFLRVVLTDVRVVPVDAGVWEAEPVGETTADRDRRLHALVASMRHTVETVVEPQAMPVHGGLDVGLIGEVERH